MTTSPPTDASTGCPIGRVGRGVGRPDQPPVTLIRHRLPKFCSQLAHLARDTNPNPNPNPNPNYTVYGQ